MMHGIQDNEVDIAKLKAEAGKASGLLVQLEAKEKEAQGEWYSGSSCVCVRVQNRRSDQRRLMYLFAIQRRESALRSVCTN